MKTRYFDLGVREDLLWIALCALFVWGTIAVYDNTSSVESSFEYDSYEEYCLSNWSNCFVPKVEDIIPDTQMTQPSYRFVEK